MTDEIVYENKKKTTIAKMGMGLYLLNQLLAALLRIPHGAASVEDWEKFDAASNKFAAAGNDFVDEVANIFTKKKPEDPPSTSKN
jgi:hypothetical protein